MVELRELQNEGEVQQELQQIRRRKEAVAAAAAAAAPSSEQEDVNLVKKPNKQESNELRDLHAPACIGFLIAVVLAAIIVRLATPSPKLFTKQELLIYNGTDETKPIFLAILGSVFDVTKGKSHYGPGGSYNHFAGRDASRAFISGNFTGTGLTDSLKGLSPLQVKSIEDWRIFYQKSYMYVGKLIGLYYDKKGNPTDELKRVEKRAIYGAQLLRKQEAEEEKYPNCNSRWSQSEGGEVWCPSGYPRMMRKKHASSSGAPVEMRCACLEKDQLHLPDLRVYQNCGTLDTVCKTS